MKSIQISGPKYRGRFAPSPTGPLHFGSLVAAVGSYLDAKSNHGEWLVRIEDLDWQREMPGAASQILHTLERLGLEWDGEIIYQSRRLGIYQDALDALKERELIYPCICSRKEVADSSIIGLSGPIYPGTCLKNPVPENKMHALRIRTNNDLIEFDDRLRGYYSQRLSSDSGDFILRRADGMYAYQLAVVVDDAEQKITHVVRGADLLDSTPRQIFLQRLLRYSTPRYLHLPIVTNRAGEKLSKQTGAAAIDLLDARAQLADTLHFLGQSPPKEVIEGNLSAFWQWAQENWQVNQIPH
jgi:glutamyl-Q tRNA(Asp) synthetase